MTTVVLLRHGRTAANSSGVLAGRSPGVALDSAGEQQAADAAERLRGAPVAGIWTSPLLRCRRTAAAVARAHPDLEVHREAALIECDYGSWTGARLVDLARDPLWKTVQSQPSAVRFPDGESMVEMAARAVGAVREHDAALTASHGPEVAWVAVSHGDVIKAILADALGMHLDSFQRLLIDPASISVVRYTQSRPYVACLNTVAGDLTDLLTPARPRRRRGRRSATPDAVTHDAATHDAAVGGGLGAHARRPD